MKALIMSPGIYSCGRTTFAIYLCCKAVRRLVGVVVSVLATRPKGRRFKHGQGDVILRTIKIRSTTSFGWEVKPEVPCRKILWHVSSWSPTGMNRLNSHFLRLSPTRSRGVSDEGQSALIDKLGVSPSRSRLLTGPHSYHPGREQ
jgi:hypothetical protein